MSPSSFFGLVRKLLALKFFCVVCGQFTNHDAKELTCLFKNSSILNIEKNIDLRKILMIHAAGDCKEAIQNLSPQIPKNQVAGTGLVVIALS